MFYVSAELDRRGGGAMSPANAPRRNCRDYGERGRGTQAVTLSAARANAGGHVLATLRCASIVTTCGKRSPSTVPLSRLLCSIPSSRRSGQEFRPAPDGRGRRRHEQAARTWRSPSRAAVRRSRTSARASDFDCPARDLCERERPRHPGLGRFVPDASGRKCVPLRRVRSPWRIRHEPDAARSADPVSARIAGFGASSRPKPGRPFATRWHPNLHITPARRRPSSACFSTVARPDGPVRPEARNSRGENGSAPTDKLGCFHTRQGKLLASPFKFARARKAGVELSELLPHGQDHRRNHART